MESKLMQWSPVASIAAGTFFFYLLAVTQDRIIANQRTIMDGQQEILRSLAAADRDQLEMLKVLHQLAIPGE